jgi:UDP-glucose 4-epimerase
MGRIVLVTGVSRYLGGRMAALLAQDPDVETVIGVDVLAPDPGVPGVQIVRADIRNPVIAKVMGEARVDTVVHMGTIATPRQAGGRSTMKEINVIGTMQLLSACQRTPSVESLVVKSTSAVYGSGPKDPAKFAEDMEPRHPPTSGWPKDSVEVESYVRGFSRRRPDVSVTTLRLARVLGPRMRTSMTAYFSMKVVPTPLGYDPRMQFVHEDDVLGAIQAAVHRRAHGPINVAGDGVLLLSQALLRAGRPILPVIAPLLPSVGRALAPRSLVDFSTEGMRYLQYGRALDTTAMRENLGFVPAYTTAEAFSDFLQGGRTSQEVNTVG